MRESELVLVAVIDAELEGELVGDGVLALGVAVVRCTVHSAGSSIPTKPKQSNHSNHPTLLLLLLLLVSLSVLKPVDCWLLLVV